MWCKVVVGQAATARNCSEESCAIACNFAVFSAEIVVWYILATVLGCPLTGKISPSPPRERRA